MFFPFVPLCSGEGVRQVESVSIATGNEERGFLWVQTRQDAGCRVEQSRILPAVKCMLPEALKRPVSEGYAGTRSMSEIQGT